MEIDVGRIASVRKGDAPLVEKLERKAKLVAMLADVESRIRAHLAAQSATTTGNLSEERARALATGQEQPPQPARISRDEAYIALCEDRQVIQKALLLLDKDIAADVGRLSKLASEKARAPYSKVVRRIADLGRQLVEALEEESAWREAFAAEGLNLSLGCPFPGGLDRFGRRDENGNIPANSPFGYWLRDAKALGLL